MKSIIKTHEPRELIQWKLDNVDTPQNLKYGEAGFPAEKVREALLLEQFHLCAYTMMRLQTVAACETKNLDLRNSCHIEHIFPQCRNIIGEDIDYDNMIACYPPSNSKIACEFGAKFKDSVDPTDTLFISPLSANVHQHFSFDENGGIRGQTNEGLCTIEMLNLNHPELKNDRAAVIKGYLKPRGKPLSAKAARRLAVEVQKSDAQKCLPPYCTAVATAALVFADREERRAMRLRKKTPSR